MAVVKSYIADNYINKRGDAPVYVSFYIAREKIQLPCKTSVAIKAWDKDAGKVTTRDKFHSDKNLIIDHVKKRVNEILVQYRLANKELTKEAFMKEFTNPTDFKSFYEFVKWYQRLRFQEIEPTTAAYHNSVMNKLRLFRAELRFEDLTEDFIREYKVYMKKSLKNKDTTVNKNLTTIKIYVTDAVKRKYMEKNPFEDLKIRRSRTDAVDFLTEEELMKLVELYSSGKLKDNYHKVLGFFLFMCFTSLHIGDAKQVKMEQLSQTTLTYYRIKNRNSKPEPIYIPLAKPAKKLIKKIAGLKAKGLLFENMYSDQRINKFLKQIASIAGINKKLCAKTGRHTFATIFLKKTKDIRSLQELLGHSSLQETMVYAHVLDESIREGMEVFNSFEL